jgi:adenine-specific DNA-methyltransferase
MPTEWADHAIACVYAVLMPHDRRKALGAYFTPPHLVDHLLRRMSAHGLDIAHNRIRDPSAGGAAFLVPVARRMVAAWRAEGLPERTIMTWLRRRLLGIELDKGLAAVANALLRKMLRQEFAFKATATDGLFIVQQADALSSRFAAWRTDHEIGNPPYRRLPSRLNAVMQKRFADIASGRLNLYTIFMRRALAEVPPGGLVGHVVPASFLGGPEFSAFRKRLLELAEVLVVDLIDQRSNVFVDATQDACFVVLRRRARETKNEPCWASSGVLHGNGHFATAEQMWLAADGSPWHLPGEEGAFKARLADWGYRASVGYLVPHRQADRMHEDPGVGRVPLIWAKAIGQDGSFDHSRGLTAKRGGWVSVPPHAAYVIRDPCVVVQRTSSRDQRQRVVAAAVPDTFLRQHGGLVGENHVILLVRTQPDAPPPEALADVLNQPRVSMAINRVCGSASIPVGAIAGLRLPPPHKLPDDALGNASDGQTICRPEFGQADCSAQGGVGVGSVMPGPVSTPN